MVHNNRPRALPFIPFISFFPVLTFQDSSFSFKGITFLLIPLYSFFEPCLLSNLHFQVMPGFFFRPSAILLNVIKHEIYKLTFFVASLEGLGINLCRHVQHSLSRSDIGC